MNNIWITEKDRPIDIICMGRVAIDLYAEQTGIPLQNVSSFKKYLGGCAGNIAVGCARLGLRSAMFSQVGKDAMGDFIRQALTQEKVNTTLLSVTSKHLTGLVLLGISPPDHFPLIFYRENCADMQLQKKHVQAEFLAKAKILLITGTGLSTDHMRALTLHTIKLAQSLQTRVILDLDFRPVLWGLTALGDGETRYKQAIEVSQSYQAILPHCDLIVGTEEEMLIAGDSNKLSQALANLRKLTQAPLIIKQGAQGCTLILDEVNSSMGIPGFSVTVLNVLGAGDAFISGFVRGLLHDEPWESCAAYGNACGAIVVTRHGCAPAMPSFDEMMTFIEVAQGEQYVKLSHS